MDEPHPSGRRPPGTPGPEHQRLAELTERLRAAGAADPRSWALSEAVEDIAQTARFLFLDAVWRRLRSCADDALTSPLASRIRQAGADKDDVRELVQRALGQLAWDLLYLVDEPDGTVWDSQPDRDVDAVGRRWKLIEVEPDGRPTGRDLGGLHESLTDTDPSGGEGDGWIT